MSERATGVSAGGGTAAHSGVTGGLFARPVLEADRRGDGSWLLRSAVPLAEPDPCVLTSVRRWASAGPDYPLIAERDPQGAGGPGPAATSSGSRGMSRTRPGSSPRPRPCTW